MDNAGQPLTDLKMEDFVVSEDGVRQDVSHFKPVNAPVNVIMLLDLSGSTKPKRKAMADAARKIIDALPRSEERRVGEERRTSEATYQTKKKKQHRKEI